MHYGPPFQSVDAHRTGSVSETVCDRTGLGETEAKQEEEVEVQAPLRVSVLFVRVIEVYNGAEKVRLCKTKRIGALCFLVPREPPLPWAFVLRNLLGVVVLDPESRELQVLPGETLHVEPAPLPFSAGSGVRAGATGPIPEWVSSAAGEEGNAGPRGPASFRGLFPHSGPPAAASVFCFRWSPAL
ncbi:hypothetical protein H8959_007015 [Pygathrix nigripes]